MKIPVKNRKGQDRFFMLENGTWYYDPVCPYISIEINSCKNIYSIDTSGGPMVKVGNRLCQYHENLPYEKIKKISRSENIGLFKLEIE